MRSTTLIALLGVLIPSLLLAAGDQPSPAAPPTAISANHPELTPAETKRFVALGQKKKRSHKEQTEFIKLLERVAGGEIRCNEGKFDIQGLQPKLVSIGVGLNMGPLQLELQGVCMGESGATPTPQKQDN